MAKVKLKKGAEAQSYFQKSKMFKVEDKDGNKSVLKATVISVDTSLMKQESNALQTDHSNGLGLDSNIINPPLSQAELSVLREFSSELGPNLDQFVTGVEGFGCVTRLKPMTEEEKKKFQKKIVKERDWIDKHLINFPNPSGNLKNLRKQLLHDREATGNAYMELVPTVKRNGKYSCYNRLDVDTMRITRRDRRFTKIKRNFVDSSFTMQQKTFMSKLRRFVQIVGGRKVYFKEFGDPRTIDKRTGKPLNMIGSKAFDDKGDEVNKKNWANEVYHFKLLHSRRSPYGLPRFTGNIIAIKGSRSAEESNIITQQNNNIPSLAITVAGGMLTDGSVDRLQEFVDQQIKGSLNYSKFLVLEGEGTHDGLSGSTSMKIDIKPLTNDQHTDAIWSEYDEKNNEKVRRSFRQPATLTGKSDGVSREEAQVAERLTEKYVYNPTREDLDDEWNRMILAGQGVIYHVLKTNSPNVTNDQDLVKILGTAEKTGGVTPRIAHMILSDILNVPLPPLKEDDPDFDIDVPFSISIGKLATRNSNDGALGRANQNGTMAPRGQSTTPKGNDAEKIIDMIFESIDVHEKNAPDFTKKLHELLEMQLDVDVFGKDRKDYFDVAG